jgi:signal transduction histidine kinase
VTLYKKTLLVVFLILLAMLVVLYAVSQLILVPSFQQLEDQHIVQNLQRATNALETSINAFKSTALGWSKWDDVYKFVDDRNQAFIDSNLSDTTFIDSDLDIMIFINKSNEIIYEKAFDIQANHAVPVPESLHELIQPQGLLVTHPTLSSEYGGILNLPEGTLITLSLPILTSQGEGPINGTIIWGRFLNDTRINHLSTAVNIPLTFFNYDEPTLSSEALNAEHNLTIDKSYFAIPKNASIIAGYTRINDLYGKPVSLLQIELPRTIYAQGQTTLTYFMLVMVLIGLVFSFVTVIQLNRNVLRWLSLLSAAVTQVRNTGKLQTPIKVPGNDEIAILGAGLQAMLEELDASRHQLEMVNAELEQRVQARTADLTKAIELLQLEVIERQRAQEQALEASKLKTQILSNVSHDARTPLSAIMLYTESMQRGFYGPITEKQAARLDGIMASSKQLLNFITSLLDVAQLNNGSLKLTPSNISVPQLVRDIDLIMTPQIERKGLKLEIEVDPALPSTIVSDERRLKQIIINLFDNAIKFTEHGAITLRIAKLGDAQFTLTIKDTGHGIPKEAQQRIFEAFWQVDGTMTRVNNRGVGLGLSIVKQLVELMGGTITVDSELGQGTAFIMHFPLLSPSPEDLAAT